MKKLFLIGLFATLVALPVYAKSLFPHHIIPKPKPVVSEKTVPVSNQVDINSVLSTLFPTPSRPTLEQRIAELEKRVAELEQRTAVVEAVKDEATIEAKAILGVKK